MILVGSFQGCPGWTRNSDSYSNSTNQSPYLAMQLAIASDLLGVALLRPGIVVVAPRAVTLNVGGLLVRVFLRGQNVDIPGGTLDHNWLANAGICSTAQPSTAQHITA